MNERNHHERLRHVSGRDRGTEGGGCPGRRSDGERGAYGTGGDGKAGEEGQEGGAIHLRIMP
jgi:hypothetical protein